MDRCELPVLADDASWVAIWRFALSYNAYEHHGDDRTARIGNASASRWSVDGSLPDDLVIARTALFYEQRRYHYCGEDPKGDDARYVKALVARIHELSGPEIREPAQRRKVLKALTVRQPWASLIMSAQKDIENRPTRIHHRGRLAIHAAKQVDWGDATRHQAKLPRGDLPRGVVLGTVRLVDVVSEHESPWADPNYAWHWVLESPLPFPEPFPPAKGKLGLWNWEPPLELGDFLS